MCQVDDKAFELGREIGTLRRRVRGREEVLVHQSCDEMLDILEDTGSEDIVFILTQIEDIIEWAERDVWRAIFWLFIKSKGKEIENMLEREVGCGG